MIVAFWALSGLLALVFLAAGAMKLARPKEALASSGMGWANDFSSGPVKLIGLAEVLGAVGLVLPALLNIVPVLSPIAAVALAVLMFGAVVVHLRRKEAFLPALVLALFSAATAVIGFLTVV